MDKKEATQIQADSVNDNQFFVTKTTPNKEVVKADRDGKFLVFDIVDFKELPPKVYEMLSTRGKKAYIMDRRLVDNASIRMEDGQSPFSDVRDAITFDPLSSSINNKKFFVDNPKEGMKYLFPHYSDGAKLIQAGYKAVDPKGDVVIPNAVEKGGKLVFTDSKGNPEHICLEVPQDKYDQHIKHYGDISKKRLGLHKERTKEKMRRYDPKVHIYDKSNF